MLKNTHSLVKSVKLKKPMVTFVALTCAAVGAYIIVTTLASPASVACSPHDSSHGAAGKTIEVAEEGSYRVWSRMMLTSEEQDSYNLGIANECISIAATDIPSGEWQWVDYQEGDADEKIDIDFDAGTHQVYMVGADDGVKLDKIMLVSDTECIPQGTGENCLEDSEEQDPEPEVPSAPTNLEGVVLSHDRVELTWEGESPYYFLVYRDNTLLAAHDGSQDNQYVDTSVEPDTRYSYYVTAIDEDHNESESSQVIELRTDEKEDTEAPTAPRDLEATVTDDGRVDLTWSSSSDNAGVEGYLVYRDDAVVQDIDASQTSWSDENTSTETTYSYYVRAYDAAGNISEASEVVSATTPSAPDETPPNPPAGLEASVVSKKQVNLTWDDASGAAYYQVYRNDQLTATVEATSFGDGSVKPNRDYQYYVVAVSSEGYSSDPSETVKADTSQADQDEGDDDEDRRPGQGWGRGGRR